MTIRTSEVTSSTGDVVVLGTTGAWHVRAAADGAGWERRIATEPVAYGADGALLTGEAARQRLAESPNSGLVDVASRVRDSAPVVLSGQTVAAEDLLAGALRSQVGDTTDLTVVVPADWDPKHQERLRTALERVGLTAAPIMTSPLAILEAPGLRLPSAGSVLVIEAGERQTVASLVEIDPEGRRVGQVARAEFGGGAIDEALAEAVRPQLRGRVSDEAAFRLACRAARERLSLVPSTELHPPGARSVVLTRAELHALVGDRWRATVADLTGRVGATGPDAVVLAGGLARMPLLFEVLSDEVDHAVQVPAAPDLAAAHGALRAAGSESPIESTRTRTAHHESSRREPRRAVGALPLRRRHAGVAAAAVGVATVLGAPAALLAVGLPDSETAAGDSSVSSMPELRAARTGSGALLDSIPGSSQLQIIGDILRPKTAAAATTAPKTASPLKTLLDQAVATVLPSLAPTTTTVVAPGTTAPAAPGTTTPAAPGTTTPAAPGTTTPAAPGTTTPAAPGTTTPAAPGTTTPTQEPTQEPQPEPTQEPQPEPTQEPTQEPQPEPAQEPTQEPQPEPAQEPTQEPQPEPTQEPTQEPQPEPEPEPDPEPSVTASSDPEPSSSPSA